MSPTKYCAAIGKCHSVHPSGLKDAIDQNLQILCKNLPIRENKNMNNNKSYNTITNGTCQSNNLIYCLECNWCHIKYVGQTKNRIIDRFQGHIFDIKHNNNTTVARHFYSHMDQLYPRMTTHILEYIRFIKDVPRSNSLRDNSELVWIH